MPNKIKKFVIGLIVVISMIVLVTPPALYFHTINLVDVEPDKAEKSLTQSEVDQLWGENEHCSPVVCSGTTPYWIYRWLVTAVISDNITKLNPDTLQYNMSVMASQIALSHIRAGHFKGKGMLWWHLTHTFMGIWLQRNWSANEISAKYVEINAQ